MLFTSLGVTSPATADTDTNRFISLGGRYYVGQSSFPLGDVIEITAVERAADGLVVRGHYELASADQALLALYTTTTTADPTPTDPKQTMQISRGKGDFELTHPNLVPGLNHVTMYSEPGGRPFAGVYFGTKEEAAEESNLSLHYYRDATAAESPTSSETHPHNGDSSMSGPNRVLLEYLGEPVQPPSNMDARYTTEGLSNAVQIAAQNAGITVKGLAIEGSEFPYIIGVICKGSDVVKLKSELKKMDGYEYNGSIGNDTNSDGSDTCNAFSIIPYKAYPPEASQQIYRRLWLRQQVFFDRVSRAGSSH